MDGEISDRGCARRGREQGFATVWVLSAMAMVAFATVVSAGEGVAVIERHRAASAADAAALAAALHTIDGPAVACADAGSLAHANGAVVSRCTVAGAFSEVVVTIRLPGPLAGLGSATGRARAGPVS
jgi:secretion/DNA translocation related TadE-like protein